MELELDSLGLTAFLTLCATMNFTRAAHVLHITQSALSHRIRRFEESLGTKLIVRDTQGLKLTSAGFEVLRYGRKKRTLENDLKLKLSRTKEPHFAHVRIGAFSSVLRSVIMPALAPLIREHDNLNVEFFSREIYELGPMLFSGALDFAIITNKLDDADFSCIHLFDEQNVLVKQAHASTPEIYLDHDSQDQTTANYFQHKKLIRDDIQRRYCDDIYGIIDGVLLGLGYAVVPLHLIRLIGGLEIVDQECVLPVPVLLHYPRHKEFPLLHMKIIDALTKNCPRIVNLD